MRTKHARMQINIEHLSKRCCPCNHGCQVAFKRACKVLMWRTVSDRMDQLLSSWENDSAMPNQAFPRALGMRLLQTRSHSSGVRRKSESGLNPRSTAVISVSTFMNSSSCPFRFIKSVAASESRVWSNCKEVLLSEAQASVLPGPHFEGNRSTAGGFLRALGSILIGKAQLRNSSS